MASFGKYTVHVECPSCKERGVSTTVEWDNGDFMTPPHREARVDTGICSKCGHVLSEEQFITAENIAYEGVDEEPESQYDTLEERDMDRDYDEWERATDFSPDDKS